MKNLFINLYVLHKTGNILKIKIQNTYQNVYTLIRHIKPHEIINEFLLYIYIT